MSDEPTDEETQDMEPDPDLTDEDMDGDMELDSQELQHALGFYRNDTKLSRGLQSGSGMLSYFPGKLPDGMQSAGSGILASGSLKDVWATNEIKHARRRMWRKRYRGTDSAAHDQSPPKDYEGGAAMATLLASYNRRGSVNRQLDAAGHVLHAKKPGSAGGGRHMAELAQ